MQETLDFPAGRVKMIRVLLKLSPAEFAAAYGFSESAVRKWESGERSPTEVAALHGLLKAAEDAKAKGLVA